MVQGNRVTAMARVIIIDSLKKHALQGLIGVALLFELGGFLFFDFLSRDIGRASNDFIFSVSWVVGLIFLFFHAVQVISWDDEQGSIHSLLARPISRYEYVLGTFCGLAFLLIVLNLLLGAIGYGVLYIIKGMVDPFYFKHFSWLYYFLTWIGLTSMELMLLSIIILFSGLIRGSFKVLLISLSFYLICTGLPVVRDSLRYQTEIVHAEESISLYYILKTMTAFFPNFDRLDFKDFVVSAQRLPEFSYLFSNFALIISYITIIMWAACSVYNRRDI